MNKYIKLFREACNRIEENLSDYGMTNDGMMQINTDKITVRQILNRPIYFISGEIDLGDGSPRQFYLSKDYTLLAGNNYGNFNIGDIRTFPNAQFAKDHIYACVKFYGMPEFDPKSRNPDLDDNEDSYKNNMDFSSLIFSVCAGELTLKDAAKYNMEKDLDLKVSDLTMSDLDEKVVMKLERLSLMSFK